VKVFTVGNVSDIKRSDILRGYNDKKLHRCPFKVYVREMPPLFHPAAISFLTRVSEIAKNGC
jgi:hypothetical protein